MRNIVRVKVSNQIINMVRVAGRQIMVNMAKARLGRKMGKTWKSFPDADFNT